MNPTMLITGFPPLQFAVTSVSHVSAGWAVVPPADAMVASVGDALVVAGLGSPTPPPSAR